MKLNLKNVFLSVGIAVFALTLFSFSTNKAEAAACVSTAGGGAWTTTGTWTSCGGLVPQAGDTVEIAAGHTVTLGASDTINAVTSLTIDGTGVLTNAATISIPTVVVTGTGTLTNSGTLTVGAAISGAGTITNTGTLNLGGTSSMADLTVAAGTVNYVGAGQTVYNTTSHTYYNLGLSGSGAKVMTGITTVSNNFSMSGSATASPVITTIGGALDISGTAAMTTGASLTVTGASSVGSGTSLTNAAGFTLTAPTTVVDGTLTNNGIFTVATSLTGAGTVVNNASTSTLNIGQSGIPSPTITATAADNTVVYSAASPNCKATTYSILNFTGGAGAIVCATTAAKDISISSAGGARTWSTSSSITLTGTLTVGSSVSMTNAANMTLTAPTITVTGALLNSGIVSATSSLAGGGLFTNNATGTLNIGNTSGITGLTATAVGNTVNYNGAGDQTVHTGPYSNLTLSTSGNKTLTTLTIAGDLTISGSAKALLTDGTSSTSNRLYTGGFLMRPGVWGSFAGVPTVVYYDNTYFVAANTGKLTVATGKIVRYTGDVVPTPPTTTTTSSSTTTVTTTPTTTTTTTVTTTPTTPTTPGGLIVTAVPPTTTTTTVTTTEKLCPNGKTLASNCSLAPITTTTTTTYNFGTTTLKNGSKGEAVMELQRFLNAKLNLGLVVDGKLGPKTIAVIKQWQRDNGLVADGLIGAKTKAKMNSN